jgi:hypothetical protein
MDRVLIKKSPMLPPPFEIMGIPSLLLMIEERTASHIVDGKQIRKADTAERYTARWTAIHNYSYGYHITLLPYSPEIFNGLPYKPLPTLGRPAYHGLATLPPHLHPSLPFQILKN